VLKISFRFKKKIFSIKVVTISDNSDHFSLFAKQINFPPEGGGRGVTHIPPHHFSSSFTLISAHTNFHDPRTTPSGRKVIRRRKKEMAEGMRSVVECMWSFSDGMWREKKTMNSVATLFATQPVCNAARRFDIIYSF
jgi:hypothetical protein